MKEAPETVALVGNGAIHDLDTTAELIKSHQQVVAVDGGLCYCEKMGICPDLILGDLDSAPPHLVERYSHVQIERFPTDKDETDMELALEYTFYPEIEKITIFAALEKRTDHALYNLYLLHRYPEKAFIESESELLFAFENEIELNCSLNQEISLIPLTGPVTGVSSNGLKWELHDRTMNPQMMSISNECLKETISIKMRSGKLLCRLGKVK